MPAESYYKIKVLGQGSFGKVFLVKNKDSGQYHALKVMQLEGIPPAEKEATKQELKLMQSLTHPNIISYIEHYLNSDNTALNIVMGYCDGGDLQGIISKAIKNRKYIKETVIVNFFVQILLGLEYMHQNRVIHRDIKTQNIFLLGNGRLVLGDLGISTVLQQTSGMAKTKIGTPYYMAPEIYQNSPYNNKCDVWSLGCVLYELLTLRHPFDGASMIELSKNVTTGFYKPISNQYNRNLHDIVQLMLCKDPIKRPSLSDVIDVDYIKLFITEYMVSIVQRPSSTMTEGTLNIKKAVQGAAEKHGVNLHVTATKIPIASPQIGTLIMQLEKYKISQLIINKIDNMNNFGFIAPPPPPPGSAPPANSDGYARNESKLGAPPNPQQEAAFQQWNQEQNRYLLREMEKKKALEMALDKLKKEKEERMNRLKLLKDKRLNVNQPDSKHSEGKFESKDDFPPDFDDDKQADSFMPVPDDARDELNDKEHFLQAELNETTSNYVKLKDFISQQMHKAGYEPTDDTGMEGDKEREFDGA